MYVNPGSLYCILYLCLGQHNDGLYNEATDDEYKAAEKFCKRYAVQPPRLLPSHIVDRIAAEGCKAWGIRVPTIRSFVGRVEAVDKGSVVKVVTGKNCKSVCLMSELPIMGGLYDTKGKQGVYYEVQVNRMEGIVAIGE